MEQVKVALLIGDIYDLKEMPAPFDAMAKVFSYDDEAENIGVGMEVSDDISVVMTAVSVTPFSRQITKLSQGNSADFGAAHLRAVQIVVNERVDSPLNTVRLLSPDIFVAGQTILFEEVARNIAWRKKGLWNPLMIRFSSFYGGPSAHSGNSAKNVGYNLDLPKSLLAVKRLLTSEQFLKSVLTQNQDLLISSVNEVNMLPEFENQPVLLV